MNNDIQTRMRAILDEGRPSFAKESPEAKEVREWLKHSAKWAKEVHQLATRLYGEGNRLTDMTNELKKSGFLSSPYDQPLRRAAEDTLSDVQEAMSRLFGAWSYAEKVFKRPEPD